MSCLAIQSSHRLLNLASSQCASSSTRTRHSRIHSSTLLLSQSCSSHTDAELLDSLDDASLDTDQRSASSATLLSRRVSSSLSSSQLLTDVDCASSEFDLSTRLSESRPSHLLYPLHMQPGQLTAQRTQRLRARTAVIIMSIPATCEDAINAEPPGAVEPIAQPPKLRRVSGVRDLRRAFRDDDHFASIPSLGVSKASYELGILAAPTTPVSPLSPRSSLRTLVDVGNAPRQISGGVKTLCESTLGSISISSRFATKLHSAFSPSRTSRKFLPNDTSHGKYHVHNLSIVQSRRHTSLHLDTPPSQPPGESIWSCAKISQSAVKRAARRGHVPRRVFSQPIAALAS